MRLLRIFALIAFVLAFTPSPAIAVTGFDSAYAGESAFVTVDPGETASFQVFFRNTGTVAWTTGSDTQVDLAACLADKVTCNAQDPADAPWNNGWLSTTRYATHTQTVVSTGSIATFAYNIKAPSNATAGTNRFNGDLVVAKTGDRIHPDGYYQDATIEAIGSVASPSPSPTPGSTPFPSPPPPTRRPTPTQALTCFDGTTDTANGETGGAIYGGVCTLTGARSATLNNVPLGQDGAYSGVYFVPDSLTGDMLADVTALSFNFTGSGVPATGPRFTIPVDADIDEDALDGVRDFYITMDAPRDCNDGAGFADAIHDATCTIYTLGLDPATEGTTPLAANWAAMVAAHPTWKVATGTSFIISDGSGTWSLSNVHIGN
jgi:hypothetical protein